MQEKKARLQQYIQYKYFENLEIFLSESVKETSKAKRCLRPGTLSNSLSIVNRCLTPGTSPSLLATILPKVLEEPLFDGAVLLAVPFLFAAALLLCLALQEGEVVALHGIAHTGFFIGSLFYM